MSSHRLDIPELRRRLDQRRIQRGLTWQELAVAVDLSPSLFSRLAAGLRPDADALVTLLVWLDLDTDVCVMIKPKDAP